VGDGVLSLQAEAHQVLPPELHLSGIKVSTDFPQFLFIFQLAIHPVFQHSIYHFRRVG